MRILSILAVSYLIFNVSIFSQEITGDLECRIINEDGQPIYHAILDANSPSLQGTRSSLTNEDGYIRISLLPPGYYSLSIRHISYEEVKIDSIRIRLGKTTDIGEIKIESEPVEMQQVVVYDKKNLIDPTSTMTGGNLSLKEIDNLPLQRNFQAIPLLLPQINSSYYNDGISYIGTTGLENRILIDGIESTEPLYFSTGTILPYNFIKEVDVVTGGYQAEYRSSLGSILNVLTQTGSDRFSGQVFAFYTSNRFSADPRSVPGKDPDEGDYSLYDVGINIGGPIISEKLWLNVAYNPNFQNEDVNIPGIGLNADKTISHLVAGKLSWRISEKLQLLLNFSGQFNNADRVAVSVPSGLETYSNPDPALVKSIYENYSPSVRAIYFISDNFFLEGSLSRLHLKFSFQPNTEIGKQVTFFDYVNKTISGGVREIHNEIASRLNSSVKATVSFDQHLLKFGIEYLDNSFDRNQDVQYYRKFSDSLYYHLLIYQHGQVGNRIPSVFIQDSWRINRNWQLNAGLRWEEQYIISSDGKVAQSISNQFQPRVGLVFIPDTYGNHKIFAFFGRFYQELADAVISYYYLEGTTSVYTRFNHDPRENRTGGDTLNILSSNIQDKLDIFKGQYSDEYSLGYENRFMNNYKFTIRGLYRTSGQVIEDAFSTKLDRLVLGNPGIDPLEEYPELYRDYLALELTLQKLSNDPFNFFISYVLSRNYGNYQGLFDNETGSFGGNASSTFDYPEMVQNSTGLLPYDRTHSIKINSSYRFNFGLSIGATFSWISGTPLNEFGVGANNFSRIFLIPRGTAGRTTSIWDLNMRLSYNLPITPDVLQNTRLIVDIFHIASKKEAVTFDQTRYLGVDENGNQIFPNPTYGQATRYFPPMSFRIGMEINF